MNFSGIVFQTFGFLRMSCFFETGKCSHPFVKGMELIGYTSLGHPLLEVHLFYNEKVVTALHSLKFTVFSAVASRYHNSNLATNYGIFLAAGMKYWKITVLFNHIIYSHSSFLR